MNNGAFPFFRIINKLINLVLHRFIPWFSETVLKYEYDYAIYTNGSGDTTYDWITLLLITLIALIGATLWSVSANKRTSYNNLHYWLSVVIRYYLAFILINYGLAKINHGQFPEPSFLRLTQPLGDLSPMGLAWTFFGFSKGYGWFMAIVEISSVLLLFRRTLLIGTLITLATAINIAVVNYCFDIPVKLLSTALVFLSLFLLLPHLKSLYYFFILQKPVAPRVIKQSIFSKKWKQKSTIVLKTFVIMLFLFPQITYFINRSKLAKQYAYRSTLYGIYPPRRRALRHNPYRLENSNL